MDVDDETRNARASSGEAEVTCTDLRIDRQAQISKHVIRRCSSPTTPHGLLRTRRHLGRGKGFSEWLEGRMQELEF